MPPQAARGMAPTIYGSALSGNFGLEFVTTIVNADRQNEIATSWAQALVRLSDPIPLFGASQLAIGILNESVGAADVSLVLVGLTDNYDTAILNQSFPEVSFTPQAAAAGVQAFTPNWISFGPFPAATFAYGFPWPTAWHAIQIGCWAAGGGAVNQVVDVTVNRMLASSAPTTAG